VSILLLPPPLLLLMTLILWREHDSERTKSHSNRAQLIYCPTSNQWLEGARAKGAKATQRGKEGKMWHLNSHD
jgi:hypothetical protein